MEQTLRGNVPLAAPRAGAAGTVQHRGDGNPAPSHALSHRRGARALAGDADAPVDRAARSAGGHAAGRPRHRGHRAPHARGRAGHHLPRRDRAATCQRRDREPGLLRPADQPAQPPPAHGPHAAAHRGQRAQRPVRRPAVPGPGPLQDPQRHHGARSGRPAAAAGGRAPEGLRAARGHGGAPGRRRVRGHAARAVHPQRGGGRPGAQGGREDPAQAQRALFAGRAHPPQHAQHRRHADGRQPAAHGGPAQAGRHRHVPGQVAGAQRAVLLRSADADRDQRARAAGGRPADGPHGAAICAALPAAVPPGRPHGGRRGPDPLAAPGAWAGSPGRIHWCGRGE